jgi:hypothetical protein
MMKRRSFLKNSAMAAGAASMVLPALGSSTAGATAKSIFELRVYHISRANNAKKLLEQYFKDALIPFLNKRNIKFGAFNEYSLEEPVKLFVLLACPDPSAWFSLQGDMLTDETFLRAAETYNKIPASAAVFTRYESFLLDAFDKFPTLSISPEKKHLFELRTYESASEDAGRRKIAMFNNEEIALFLKVGLQPVFFGKIIAGQYMPALTYMLGFNDMTERDATWSKFGSHDDWKKMQAKLEYADTVSNIYKTFLTPADYSQI